MKLQLFSIVFFSLFLSLTSCKKDRIDFHIEKFTINDRTAGLTGKHDKDDLLKFYINLSVFDNYDGYGIEDFEFTYSINGRGKYIIQSDDNIDVESVLINSDIYLPLIELPEDLNGELIAGDKIEFEIWARDSNGDEISKIYTAEIE
jgi:hypothetical protein